MLRTITKTAIGLTGLVILTSGVLSDNGKAGKTGSPGELNCRDCHDDFALNSGGGSIGLASSNLFGWEYVPGTTYHMTCTVARTGTGLFGLGLEALTTSNANAGTLTITNSSTQIKNATVSGVSRRNVVHTLNGGQGTGSKAFAFDWTAPTTDVGNVTFYYCGVAANGDGHDNIGDYVYTGSQVVTPATTNSIQEVDAKTGQVSVYPDPVVDVMNIGYELEREASVQVDLYDQSGRRVQHLLNTRRQPGRQVEMFNGLSAQAAGLHILRTSIDGVVDARTIVLRGALD